MNFLDFIWKPIRDLFSFVGRTHPKNDFKVEVSDSSDRSVVFPPEGPQPEDFICADGTLPPEDNYDSLAKLAENISILEAEINKPVVILNGFQTEEVNKITGGSKTHIDCTGVDIKVKGISRNRLAKKIDSLIREGKMDKGGLAIYPDRVHYDVRGKNVRWTGKKRLKKLK